MDAAGKSSPLSSFKSKKQLHSPAPSDQKMRKFSDLESDPLSVKTPGKLVDPPRRSHRRTAVLSIKEIRQAAMKLRERGPDPPAREDPELGSEKEHISKPKKSVRAEITLPEKYELLDKFFNSLDCSIRLLQLKRYTPTFTDISSQIQCLTDRRFTHKHLAQLKFIVPEAIVLEKVLRLDEQTSCMKPDLRITLNLEALNSPSKSKSQSSNLQLRKVFRCRLLEFLKSHPECDEVPEEELPEPFNRLKDNARANSTQPSSSSLMSGTPNVALSRQPIAGSHLSQSFKRHFSQKGSDQYNVSAHDSSVSSEYKFAESSSGKEDSEIDAEKFSSSKISPSTIPSSPLPETPVKNDNQCSVETAGLLKTPVHMASTPAKLMSATPMIQPPKRCYMSPDDNSSYKSPTKLIRRPPPNRPLKFDTPVKDQRRNSSANDDILDILPEGLLQSIREKERLAAIERDPAISQAKWRKQMIAGLPKVFDMIYFLFQSIRRSVLTKEELMQKLTCHLDIVDKRDVEEQLRLLRELAPEWIYEKLALSGDILLCVNKISSPDAIRTRLSGAM
ncbi:hypothetical protein ABFX02_11G022700 [Erythranthe guttata]